MNRAIITLILFCGFFSLHSQENDSLSYAEQLALLEAEMDSLSIFNLIDSLFEFEVNSSSELNVRFGFTSSVTSAGRDYNLDQQGYSPGITYYHKSGLYGDLSGYWSSDISPKYNPTIISLGYLGSLNKNLSYSFDYEKWFFNPKDTSLNPLTHSIGTSASYDFKIGFVNLDYSYLFGDETSHRIIGTLTGNIRLGKWWKFNSINLYPSASFLFGNDNVTILRLTEQSFRDATANRISGITTFENFSTNQRGFMLRLINTAAADGIISEQQRQSLVFKLLGRGRNLSETDLQTLELIASGVYQTESLEEENKFGLLNYSFSVPLAFSSNRLTILISYTYSIPLALPGEELLELDPIGYFAFSVNYRIPFKK